MNDYMSLDYNYNINLKLSSDGNLDTTALKNLISLDLMSNTKKSMYDGKYYYSGKHSILGRQMSSMRDGIPMDDDTSNNRIPHPFHRTITDQKVSYLTGKPITIDIKSGNKNDLNNIFNDYFNDLICETIKESTNTGVAWWHIYIDENGDFNFILIPSEEIIPIYDNNFQNKLQQVVRYYGIPVIDKNGNNITRYKVEIWDNEKVTFYVQDEQGNYYFDTTEPINPRYHYYVISYNEQITNHSWGRVPFVKFENNNECTSDLLLYKSLIDVFDLTVCNWSNSFADLQDVIFMIYGHTGDPYEIRRNIMTNKLIFLDENSKIEPLTINIPYESRLSFLKEIKENIFTFGQSVDLSTDKFGNAPSGISLKFLYNSLDLKCDKTERKLKKGLQDFILFVSQFLKSSVEVDFTFNRANLINETEMIDNAIKSKSLLSSRTSISMHPKISNVDDELSLIEEEKDSYVELDEDENNDQTEQNKETEQNNEPL